MEIWRLAHHRKRCQWFSIRAHRIYGCSVLDILYVVYFIRIPAATILQSRQPTTKMVDHSALGMWPAALKGTIQMTPFGYVGNLNGNWLQLIFYQSFGRVVRRLASSGCIVRGSETSGQIVSTHEILWFVWTGLQSDGQEQCASYHGFIETTRSHRRKGVRFLYVSASSWPEKLTDHWLFEWKSLHGSNVLHSVERSRFLAIQVESNCCRRRL